VLVDRGQIEQVLMNLAVNARDAMAQGGKLVIETQNADLDEDFVSTHVDLTTGRYVRISVSDTGQGMTADVADRAVFRGDVAQAGKELGAALAGLLYA